MHLKNMKDCVKIMIIAVLPTKLNRILKYNHGEKSLKMPFVIYADLECLLLKQQSCQNSPDESCTERKAVHKPCGYALDLVYPFYSKQNKHSFIEERIVLQGLVVN